jgi:hypothetical protein
LIFQIYSPKRRPEQAAFFVPSAFQTKNGNNQTFQSITNPRQNLRGTGMAQKSRAMTKGFSWQNSDYHE